ncbi:MAG: 5'-nucleotidase C-terminal domain-containing protein [Eubacterium sp.]|nr:5'-nucleotidase C-terminal domain-containing protein [Eubacterium sp.]
MSKTGTKKRNRVLSLLLVLALVWMSCPQAAVQAAAKKKTEKQPQPHTAALRIISTTDLHGQVSTTHYDTASEKPGSLAQAYTLIKEARQEVGTRNTMTVDTGDSVYGYAADYLKEQSEDTVQPIYKAMAMVNYDVITLGNHDFDYGYQYIDKQLELSGLKKKCVLSNIILADTGETAWEETKMISKQLKTSKNKSVNVEIGVVGVTIPSMSSYSNCKEDLIALPIVSTVEKQAAYLKAQGADLVIAVAHSSFGNANPDPDSDNAVYALTKLANVDAVVAGHGHKNYPSTDSASAVYYRLPNVDKKTGLMNGKAVTMIKDHGAGIGIIDLNLEIQDDGQIKVAESAAELRMVTKDTPSSNVILESQEPEIDAVNQSLSEVIGTFGSDERINSYFALLEDNYAIQLVNESKIQYGLTYTGGAGKSLYADCPVVAMTKYTLSGSQSAEDNISLNGTITMKDILNMQQDNHNNNIIYWISGGQLRELLEWTASVYAPANGTITSDAVLQQLLEERGASSIAASDWLEDWSSFAVFDGIEYTIDATRPARYTKSGEQKDAYANRIISMTYNGQPITDDQRLILVSHTIPGNTDATGTISSQKLLGKTDLAYVHLINFIKQQQEFGNLSVNTDYNWKVQFDTQRPYVVRSSVLSQTDAAMRQWFQGLLSSNETFAYYLAQFIEAGEMEQADTLKPMLIVSATVSEETNQPVEVKVQANDRSGIAQLKWAPGQEAAGSAVWETAENVTRGYFTAQENGIYSVMAQDPAGNQIVKYVNITNINPDVVDAPTVNKISNKVSAVTGTAKPGMTVHIDANGNTYEVEVLEDGTYTCSVERMPAGSIVSVFCTDETGRQSKTVSTTVFKNGPDAPVVNTITNKSDKINGYYTGSSAAVVAIIGSNVYMSAADKALYEKSELYSKSRIVNTVDLTLSRNNFEMSLPIQNAGVSVKFVTLDKAGRRSGTVSAEVADAAPNVPVLQEVCDVEDYLYGQVTNVNESGTVTVIIGDRQFTGDIQPDGTFAVKTSLASAGQVITVMANDVKDGEARTSAATAVTVKPFENYVTKADTRVQPIYSNSTQVKGDTLPTYEVNVVVRGNSTRVTLDSLGQFTLPLSEPLMAGEKVYIVARSGGKIAEVTEQSVIEYVPTVVTPETPSVLTSDITVDTQTMDVLTKEAGTLVVNIDGVDYTSQTGVFNQAYNGYIYTIQLPQTFTEQTITIHLINANGISSGSVTVQRTLHV